MIKLLLIPKWVGLFNLSVPENLLYLVGSLSPDQPRYNTVTVLGKSGTSPVQEIPFICSIISPGGQFNGNLHVIVEIAILKLVKPDGQTFGKFPVNWFDPSHKSVNFEGKDAGNGPVKALLLIDNTVSSEGSALAFKTPVKENPSQFIEMTLEFASHSTPGTELQQSTLNCFIMYGKAKSILNPTARFIIFGQSILTALAAVMTITSILDSNI